MDLTSLQNSLYGDVENDEELLAELASLAGESKPKPKRAPAAKQVTPAMINSALKDDFSDVDDEDLENDEDLQKELAGMLNDSVNEPAPISSIPPVKTHPTPPKRVADGPPPLPARGAPPVPQRSTEAPPPPPPVRSNPVMPVVHQPPITTNIQEPKTLSEAEQVRKVLRERFEAYALNLKLAKEANDIPNAKEFVSMVEMFEQAIQAAEENDLTMSDLAEVPGMPLPYKPKKARPEPKNLIEDLEMRYDKLLELAEEYKNNDEDAKARRQVRLSGQYKDAIKALKKGQAVNIAELPLIPGLPKLTDMPYAKSAMNTAPDVDFVPSQPAQIPISESLKPKPIPVHQKPEEVTGDTTEKNQLRFLLTRQQQFREAALAAKKTGDIAKAKEMLLNAKKLEPMIKASEGGLPVDIRDVPLPPQSGVSRGLMRQFSAGADVQLQEVEKALLGQLSFCDQNRTTFSEKNDSRSVMIFEKLLSETKLDILHFRQLLQTRQRPTIKVIQITLPTLQETVEKGVADDQLEVKIISIEKLKTVEGYKPHHLAIYVKCNFAFPHDSHQSEKTQIVSGTENPEFNEIIYFKINRKMRQFYRSVSRIPLKFEIYQKGSFLRSDKLWWTVEVPIAALEKQTLITSSAEIMEGRRKSTGGKLTVQVRVSRPLNDSDSGGTGAVSRKTAPTVTKKWIKIER